MGLIALTLMGVGIITCIIWSANTGNKIHRIITEIFACIGILSLLIIVGYTATLPQSEPSTDTGNIKTSESEQEQKLEITPVDTTANITITTESLTNEQLIKMFLEKWNGDLPDTLIINGVEQYENAD